MSPLHTTLEVDGIGLPITTVSRASQVPGLGHVAKSAVQAGDGDHSTLIVGFSAAHRRQRAIEVSRWEVVERAFATAGLVAQIADDDGTVPGYRWLAPHAKRRVASRDVVLGAATRSGPLDSVGLGCAASRTQAALHSICELVERHAVAEIWYGTDTAFVRGDTQPLPQGATLRRYGWCRHPRLDFVLSVIDLPSRDAWFVGSAVRTTTEAAIRKADQEALLLFDSWLEHDEGYCDTEHTRRQLASLSSPATTRARREHLATRVRHRPAPRPRDAPPLVASVRDHDPTIAILRSSNRATIVRALCPSLRSLAHARLANRGRVVADPIC